MGTLSRASHSCFTCKNKKLGNGNISEIDYFLALLTRLIINNTAAHRTTEGPAGVS